MRKEDREKIIKRLVNHYKIISKLSRKKLNLKILEASFRRMPARDLKRLYSQINALLVGAGVSTIGIGLAMPILLPATVPIAIIEAQKAAEDIERCIGSYDYSKEKRVKINGNIFCYEEDFPIREYEEDLSTIGESVKGEMYSVYLEDGELVVY